MLFDTLHVLDDHELVPGPIIAHAVHVLRQRRFHAVFHLEFGSLACALTGPRQELQRLHVGHREEIFAFLQHVDVRLERVPLVHRRHLRNVVLVVLNYRLVVEVLHQVHKRLVAHEGARGVDLFDIVRRDDGVAQE